MHCVQVSLEIGKREFIGGLKFTIVFMILLDSIVGKMDKLVVEVFHIELLGSSSNVPVLEPVTFLIPVHASHAYI